VIHAPVAPLLQDLRSFGGSLKTHPPPVFGCVPTHQTSAFEPATMRLIVGGRTCSASASSPAILGCRRPARTARKAGPARFRFAVAYAQPPQQMDGCGVQLIGDLDGVPAGPNFCLTSDHRT